MIRLLVATLLALVLAPLAPTQAAAPSPAPLLRLHATSGPGAAIRDESGAQVLLRGVNVTSLAEYYQPNPAYPTVIPLTEADFRDIAKVGLNSVRLLVTWSRLEPTPGAYDKAYVAQVKRAVGWARKYGLYVVLDMHQDAWGPSVFTPVGESCPSGMHPDNGWDGAPAWATITDGTTTCTPGEREVAPAVQHAWQHFYDNTDGIQTHLVKTWGRLAQDFARNPTVAGYDLLNEPGLGTNIITNGNTDLGRYYNRAIASIRAGEKRGKGFSHIAFFEPNVLWSNQGTGDVPPVGFTHDRNIVFAPHIYAESLSGNTIAQGFASAAMVAAGYGTTVWSGEWGFFPSNPQDAAAEVAKYGRNEDANRYGGAWWSWKQACGNPHTVPAPGAEPNPVSHGLIRYTCPDQVASGPDPAFAQVLGRPAPRRVPGRITRLTSDGRTGAFQLAGVHTKDAARCGLRVFVPSAYAKKPVHTEGITKLHRAGRPGGVVLRGCVADKFRLQIG